MESQGIYRERNGWRTQHSVRVKYDEHQELDMAKDRGKHVADCVRTLARQGQSQALARVFVFGNDPARVEISTELERRSTSNCRCAP